MNTLYYIVIYYILINLISFFTMFLDKQKAIKSKSRISEKTLFTYALFLGALGIYLGMYKFRHKTKHVKFIIGIPIMFILNCISLYYIISYAYIN